MCSRVAPMPSVDAFLALMCKDRFTVSRLLRLLSIALQTVSGSATRSVARVCRVSVRSPSVSRHQFVSVGEHETLVTQPSPPPKPIVSPIADHPVCVSYGRLSQNAGADSRKPKRRRERFLLGSQQLARRNKLTGGDLFE